MIKMSSSKWFGLAISTAFAFASSISFAQTYPAKPIKLIVPFGAGGVTDATARVFADGLTQELGQPVVVENRPGAGGGLGGGSVARSAPDGYTLLVITNGMFAVNPLIYPKLAYDPRRDFVYIGMLASTPTILAVPSASPYGSLKAMLNAAKLPGKLSFSTAGDGSDNYQVMEVLQRATGTKFLHVPYKSGAESLTATVSGQTDVTAISAATASGAIDGNQVKAFAVTAPHRLDRFPQIPTVQESIGAKVEGGSLSGIVAPAGTPASIVQRLNSAIAKVASTSAVQEKVYGRGSQRVESSRQAFEERVVAEQEKWNKILGERFDKK